MSATYLGPLLPAFCALVLVLVLIFVFLIVFVLLFFLVLVILVKGTSSVLGRSLLVFLFVVFSGIAAVEHRVVFHVGHSRRR